MDVAVIQLNSFQIIKMNEFFGIFCAGFWLHC